jgi:hypothetical protein
VDIFYGISLRKIIPNSEKPQPFHKEGHAFLNKFLAEFSVGK